MILLKMLRPLTPTSLKLEACMLKYHLLEEFTHSLQYLHVSMRPSCPSNIKLEHLKWIHTLAEHDLSELRKSGPKVLMAHSIWQEYNFISFGCAGNVSVKPEISLTMTLHFILTTSSQVQVIAEVSLGLLNLPNMTKIANDIDTY